MDELLDMIYAEIFNLAENISYLKGRSATLIEICAIHRYINTGKSRKTKQEKELYKIEKSLLEVMNELQKFAEKIPNKLRADIYKYDKKSSSENKYISAMREIC